MRGDVGQSWRRRLLNHWEIRRGRCSDLGIGALRRERERLDQIGICLHHVSAVFGADGFARLEETNKIEMTEKEMEAS